MVISLFLFDKVYYDWIIVFTLLNVCFFVNLHKISLLQNELSCDRNVAGKLLNKIVDLGNVLYSFFFIECQDECSQNILLNCRPLAFTPWKAFLWSKKKSGTNFFDSFSVYFLKKNISLVKFYLPNKFHCLVAFTSWDVGKYIICNFCELGCDVINI